jgi:hypothetical protein
MDTPNIYLDGTYLKNNPDWNVYEAPLKAKYILQILEKNGISASTVCEIGCGAGEVLNLLSAKYSTAASYCGYEISPEAHAICKGKERDNLKYFLGDAFGDDRKYDLVLLLDVLEHVEDYIGFARRVCAKGKYKIVHLPLDLSVQTVTRGSPMIKYRRKGGHLHYFTRDTAIATLEDAGYSIIDSMYTPIAFELPDVGWKANAMNIPRAMLYPFWPHFTARLLGGFSLLVLAE